jgi:c-di-GMP-binding flagellar brake protein YcgR
MPKCSLCGKNVQTKAELVLTRNAENRWVTLCSECVQDKPTEVAKEAPVPESAPDEERSLRTMQEKVGSQHTPPLRRPQAHVEHDLREMTQKFEQMRDSLKKFDVPDEAPRSHERKTERHVANLSVSFSLMRDDEICQGRIRDISQGGMRFVTNKKVDEGQIIMFEVGVENKNKSKTRLISGGEVKRVIPLEDGRFEIGVMFVRRSRAREENRRLFRRYKADMAAYYTPKGGEYVAKAKVKDISQGGFRLVLDELMETDAEMKVRVRGESGVFLKSDLQAEVRIIRIRLVKPGEYEAGCNFLQVGMVPRH